MDGRTDGQTSVLSRFPKKELKTRFTNGKLMRLEFLKEGILQNFWCKYCRNINK
jgi:hypothetical protein